MWFGTQDGLNKYDGYKFTVYKHDPLDSLSLSENFIHTILEDSKGNLWIGTDNGLNKFDTKKRTFKSYKFNPSDPTSISNSAVWSILEDKEGILWIGTADAGLNKLEFIDSKTGKAKFKRFTTNPTSGLNSIINTIYEDKDGTLWIGSSTDGLNKFDRKTGRFTTFQNRPSDNNSISNNCVWTISEDNKGFLWVGTNDGLNKLNKLTGEFQRYTNSSDRNSLSHNTIKKIYFDKEDRLWIGTLGGGLNLFTESNKTFEHFNNITYNPSSLNSDIIHSILEDRQGILWVGTDNGISRFDRHKQNFSHYEKLSGSENTLSSNVIWSLLRDGSFIWAGTSEGLDKYDREKEIYSHYQRKGFKNNTNKSIYSLYKDRSGKLWIGTDDGLYFFKNGKIEKLNINKKFDEQNVKRVYSILEDSKNNLWVGTKEGLFIIGGDKKNSTFISAGVNPYLTNNVIRSIFEDSKGNIWLGTNGGGLNKVQLKEPGNYNLENITLKSYQSSNDGKAGLNNNIILSIYEDPSGSLWLGTYGGGLNSFNPGTGKASYLTEKDGLSNNVVYSILPDKQGQLWMSTNKGISRYNPADKTFRNFYKNDGLQSNEFNIGAAYKAQDGELLFGGINGFNTFYPERIKSNPTPPEIVITDFQIFNKSVKVGKNSLLEQDVAETDSINLSYKENLFSFEFAALHYSFPEKNSYAYMLEGFDDEWNYVGNRRIAIYTKLDPGTYTFKVKGTNSDGVWNEAGASVRIVISPPFWKTWLFRISVVLAFLGLSFAWYKSRVRHIEEQKVILEKQVAERTAKVMSQKEEIQLQKTLIEAEKDKVEKLLLNILPEDTAEELKTKGKASARHYRLASVMFTDFVGFTKIAETLRPKDLVTELDKYFIEFDRIIEKYGIEKIKTIGDAYMCAGGLPIRNKSNPIDIVLAGLEIQRYMKQSMQEKKSKGKLHWELRIGIHTGELIAGVVGTKRFAYDIWGDTVNIANRLESSGEAGKVNISETTYEMASEFFNCTYRGKVKAKNKGEVDMYYVEGIRQELSVNGDGIEPNDAFHRKMSHVLYSKILYKKAEQYIIKLLSDQLPEGLFYHGIHHTIDVCDAAEKLAFLEGIEGEDVFLLKTAALFHDAGFTKEYLKNEPIGVQMSKEILPQFGYTDKQIEIIEGIIIATQVPQNPQTHLERIMCDADLDYLGRDDFHRIADTLRQELTAFGKISSVRQWDELQVSFLEKHNYFTDSSKRLRQPKKLSHLKEIKERLAKGEYEVV